jgi:GT2 family glycosyltransferase
MRKSQVAGGNSIRLTIIIPTKDRCKILIQLFESIRRLNGLDRHLPEIIVADNGSSDDTCDYIDAIATTFPATILVRKTFKPGKSAAINGALKAASGDVLAFLDDDVAVDQDWLEAVVNFFQSGEFRAGQGIIRLPASEQNDAEILRLIERYRTIPQLEFKSNPKTYYSLNGANFFVEREVFDQVGGFDERLGPGASGTSEDVDFARRLARANIVIGYARGAIVYHRVDRARLTEGYFKESHWRQGASRFLISNHGVTAITFDLLRAIAQYGYHTVRGQERYRYRSKGRIYHYLGMMEAKRKSAAVKGRTG